MSTLSISSALKLVLAALPLTLVPAILQKSQPSQFGSPPLGIFNVRAFGAKGDGTELDTDAIDRTIEAASSAGGGTVRFPAGNYLSYSIRLKSNISIYLDAGATLVAADRHDDKGYDAAEPNRSNKYQDFGHTHFHNSLIWGEKLHDVSILGQGQIFGKGLVADQTNNSRDGNKSISLRECSNVTIRDVTIRHGGWFGILATGVDHLTIDNLKIDTNRDGMDIDCCRDVHVSNCSVNSPGDDGICLKSSYALNEARGTEDVSITNCHVSGFREGSLLDGTYIRRESPTGRIKFGTESNGGFKNIAISNCVFDYCRGLALETVDGGNLEDVTISNVTMRDIINAPIYLRLGRRMRGPAGTPIGHLRRVTIDNVRVIHAAEASIIAGIPGHPVEDVSLSNIRIVEKGGAPASQANTVPPEQETAYPEPESLGKMPVYGFFIRHARNVDFNNVQLQTETPDGRPAIDLSDVDGADFFLLRAYHTVTAPIFKTGGVNNLRIRATDGLQDTVKERSDGSF